MRDRKQLERLVGEGKLDLSFVLDLYEQEVEFQKERVEFFKKQLEFLG